jgi:hypothetical protein
LPLQKEVKKCVKLVRIEMTQLKQTITIFMVNQTIASQRRKKTVNLLGKVVLEQTKCEPQKRVTCTSTLAATYVR